MQTTGLKRIQYCLLMLTKISKQMLRSLNLPTGRIRTELEDTSVMKQDQYTYHLLHISA